MGDYTTTSDQGITVTAHPVNLNRTGWSFSATDPNGRRIPLNPFLHSGITAAAAEHHARYLAVDLAKQP